jgi:predicted HTH domain antitoxin
MAKRYKDGRGKEKPDEMTQFIIKEGTMLDYETEVLDATSKLGYNKGEILHSALKMYFDANKELKEKLAVELYKEGKVSLGKASEVADVSYEEMKELLDKNKVPIRRGPVSLKELKARAEELAQIL